MEQGAYREEYSLDRYDDRERKPKKQGGGKKNSKKKLGLWKSPAVNRVAGRLNLQKKKGRGWELAAVSAAALAGPVLLVAGRRFIQSTGRRGVALFTAGAAMQVPRSKSVSKAGKVLMVTATVVSIFDGLTKLLGAANAQAQGGGAA